MKLVEHGIARRCRIDLNTPAELAIREAIKAVEAVGAHPFLTDAVVLLSKAHDKVADFVELELEPNAELKIVRKSSKGYMIFCPACKCGHEFAVGVKNRLGNEWEFNGKLDKPTFTPSMLIKTADQFEDGTPVPDSQKFICHSYVTDGMIEFLADCTHDLRGQTVPLQPF